MKKAIPFMLSWMLFRLLLDYSYVDLFGPRFAYAGFITEVNLYKLMASYVITLAWLVVLRPHVSKPSDLLFLMLSMFILQPVLSYWALGDQDTGLVVIVVISLLLIRCFCLALPTLHIPVMVHGKLYAILLSIVIGAILFAVMLGRGGMGSIGVDFDSVYERRELVYDSITTGYIAYLMSWFLKVMNPLIIAFFLVKRRYVYFSVFFIVQMFGYALTTHKEFIIYPLISIYVVYILNSKNFVAFKFVGGLLAVIIVAIILDWFGITRPMNTFVGRTFFSVSRNFFDYYVFFQENVFVFWSNSFLSSLISYPYPEPVPLIIGADRYSSGVDAFANTGYIGSGYMQGGYIGVILYSLIVALIMKYFDSLHVKGFYSVFIFVISMLSLLQIVNQDLTTALLTHGIAVAMFLAFLIRAESLRIS